MALDSYNLELKKSLAGDVADILSERIINGYFKPGQRLIESEIAKSLNISRGPIREAFRILEGEGLLHVKPRKGVVVRELTPQDIRDIYICRAYLEGLASKLATQNMTDEYLSEFTKILNNMDLHRKNKDNSGYFEQSILFHDLTNALSKNQQLYKLIRNLGKVVLLLRRLAVSVPEHLEKSYKYHFEIVEAFKEKDEEKAEMATRNLILRSGQILEKAILSI
jgi:DNA-binding GntR family transcriptional regulator